MERERRKKIPGSVRKSHVKQEIMSYKYYVQIVIPKKSKTYTEFTFSHTVSAELAKKK